MRCTMAYHPVRTADIMLSLLSCVLAWLGLLAASSLFSSAWAQYSPAPVQISDEFSQQSIGLHLSILEDPSRKLTLEDVRSVEEAKRFTPPTNKSPNFGFTQSAYWARFTLDDIRNPNRPYADLPLMLTLSQAQTNLAELWCADQQGSLVVQQRVGDHVPLVEWPISFRMPTFSISNSAHTCWLRVRSDAVQLPLTLYTHAAFVDYQVTDSTIQALYFGALLVMFAYNGLLAFTTRSRAYASYTLFLLGYGLLTFALGGIGYLLLWPNAVGFADTALPFFIALNGFAGSIFAIMLLDLRQTAPRFYKLGMVVVALFAQSLVTAWFLPFTYSIHAVTAISFLSFVFLLGSGITLSWRGVREAQIYMAAWMAFIIGTTILILASVGLLPINAFTNNASQIGSAIEFVMLSFALSYSIKTLQQRLLESVRAKSAAQTQALQAQNEAKLAKAEQVAQQASNQALQIQAQLAQKDSELARKEAELAQKEAEHAQNQLQQADKMASLGQLVASVTHEINTPIGAISSSGQSMGEALTDVVSQLPPLLKQLDDTTSTLLIDLLLLANQPKPPLSSREERALIKKVTEQLEAAGLKQARQKADFLVSFNAHQELDKYLPLLQHPQSESIEQAAGSVASAMGNARNVNVAVERVIKLVKALKSFSHFNVGTEKIDANLVEGMETVLTIYQGQTKVGVDVVRNYEDIPLLHCYPDELNQVWTNLIHNALQAMNHEGTLTIGIREENGHAVVSVSDSGCGIPEEIRGKIFDVFFTTKPAGVGSGLGLDIVKKIIDKHHGRIELQSEVGVGTTFTVMLPYQVVESEDTLKD